MSSYQLSVGSGDTLTSSDKRTPIYASFSSIDDVLAVLWETGHVELWNLHTRIEPSRGKVMAPALMWNGSIESVPLGRQIVVTTGSTSAPEGLLARLTILGCDRKGNDIVTVVELGKDSSTQSHNTKLSHRNGRLVASDETAIWQGPDGQMFEGEELHNH